MQKVIEQTLGVTNWLFLSLSVITVMFFLLSNVSKCEATEFCATTIFFQVFLGSGFMLVVLWLLYEKGRERMRVREGNKIKIFFLQDLTIKKLIYVPLGLVGVIGISYVIGTSSIPYASYMAIFSSGIVMLACFYKTNSIGVPILIHGLYNSLVVFLRSTTSLSSFPLDVPTIGINFELFGNIISEIIFQLTLVASSEELFKVFIIAFIIVSSEGGFKENNKMKYISGIFAVFVWTVYHSIASG